MKRAAPCRETAPQPGLPSMPDIANDAMSRQPIHGATTMSCPRSITFTIPGTGSSPGVTITAVEVDGKLQFTMSLPPGSSANADLRGLFFDLADDSKLAGLTASGSGMTDFDTIDVVDLGQGANMNGSGTSFDVGLEIGTAGTGKDTYQSFSFTLSNAASNLTLDDIAHMDFGVVVSGNRLMTVAPAAPDAVDDQMTVYEDGSAGLHAAADTPQGVLLQVLHNDTDADGQALTITHVEGAQHGTVQIVDGDDADTLAGDALLYTPVGDWSGSEALEYCVSDGHGGTDSAHVALTVAAVADKPLLDVQVLEGASVNEMRIVVTATQTDDDGSEVIDRIVTSGLPDGATLVALEPMAPTGQPGQWMQEFKLVLPADQDSKFDLAISAVSKEASNGDEESALHTVKVELQHTAHSYTDSFEAVDQSLWSAGDAYIIDKHSFIGVDDGVQAKSADGDLFWYDMDMGLKLGFTQDIHIEGGQIDAQMSFDMDVETLHNKTTDTLLIKSSAIATDANFATLGPSGAYALDFDFDWNYDLGAGLDLGAFGKYDLLGGLLHFGDSMHEDIIDVSTADIDLDLGGILPGLAGNISWPQLDMAGGFGASKTTSFANFQLDGDEFLSGGLANVFDISADIGVAWGTLELLDVDFSGGLSIAQSLAMNAQALTGTIHFEDGSTRAIKFGQDIKIDGASVLDKDGDGVVEFTIDVSPTVSLNNKTDLVGDIAYSIDILKAQGGYGIEDVLSGTFDVGPVAHFGDASSAVLASLHDASFDLAFNGEQLVFGG